MKASKVWDIIAYIGFGVFMLWLILKAAGVLHSPPAADIIGLVGAGVFAGRYIQKIDHMHEDLEQTKKDVGALNIKMSKVESHLPDAFK